MFALDGPRSRLAHWEKTGASAVDPAYEPAKGPGGSLLVIRLPESATEMVVVMVTRVEPLVQRLRAPDVTALGLADKYSRAECREVAGASAVDPAYEPAKVPGGSLLVMRLPESAATEMVVVMVTRVEPLMQRLRAPDVTAFALADPYSSLACRKLWVVSSDEPAF